MTAGHCVYDKTHNYGWATAITVIPCKTGSYAPFGTATSAGLSTFTGWAINGNNADDIGMVFLNREIGRSTGWHGYATLNDADTNNVAITAYGYPADRDGGENLYGCYGSVSGYTAYTLRTLTDWMGGQSGGAVLSRGALSGYLFGVISWEYSTYNQAVRIDWNKYNTIIDWTN